MSLGLPYAVIDIGVAYAERIDEVIALMRRVGETLRTDPSFCDAHLGAAGGCRSRTVG